MNGYQHLYIYYFSGTGNALLASRWIIEKAENLNIQTQLTPIDRLRKIEVPQTTGKTLIGFSSPTHGFNLPWIMIKFLWRFPQSKGQDVFLLNTRAGMKMGKYFIPGLSGIAQLLPILILWLKGYHIRGILPLDLPSNWISIHPGLRRKVVDSIFIRRRQEVDQFSQLILSGLSFYASRFFWALPFDLLIAPIALGYFLYGRFFFSKTFIAATDCINCRLCEQKCPTSSIVITNNRPYWKFTCESCMRCINICPHKSIQASHSLAAIIIFVTSSVPLVVWLNKLADEFISGLNIHLISLIEFPFKWMATLAMYYVIYLIFFYLIKLKLINRILVYTSLTKYWRRYKAPGITASDFVVPGNTLS